MKLSVVDIKEAAEVLELGQSGNLKEIKAAYRRLSKKWHPDSCPKKKQAECHKRMKEINQAYKIIMKYVEEYAYPFSGGVLNEESQEEFWKRRFGKDPIWGKGWEEK